MKVEESTVSREVLFSDEDAPAAGAEGEATPARAKSKAKKKTD
jgi:hypothetical protein